jgi:hypothetical protein
LNRIEKISSLIGDVAIPLMGYLFWNWNLYFILLFFILDQLVRVLFLPQRLKLTQEANLARTKFFVRQLVIFLIELTVIHSAVYLHQSDIHFWQEFKSFLSYKDMGIAQGYILLPLILVGEWMRISNEKKLGVIGERQMAIIQINKRNGLLRIGFFALLTGLNSFVFIPQVLLVFLFLGFIALLVFY